MPAVTVLDIVGFLSPHAARVLSTVKLVSHASPDGVWMAFMHPLLHAAPGMIYHGGPHAVGSVWDIVDTQGRTVVQADILAGMHAHGCWGFCQFSDTTIHVWWAGTTPIIKRLALVAHELEHLAGRYFKRQKADPRELEERRCDLSGAVAAKAYELVCLSPLSGVNSNDNNAIIR